MTSTDHVQRISLDFDRVAEETGVSIRAARGQVINEAARQIAKNTPVRTGRLRASWFFSPKFPAVARVPNQGEIQKTKAGSQVLARLRADAGPLSSLDGSLYFLNGASYAIYVEARTQFVRRTLAKARQIEGNAIRRIRALQKRSQ